MTPEVERQLCDDVSEIKRGLFGEPHLQQRGLIDRVVHIERWITKANLKVAAVTSVFTAALFAVKMAWEWLSAHK